MVVARQRPETAKGVDLHAARGRARRCQPDRPAAGLRAPPAARPHRAARSAPGRLERREGVINVVAGAVRRIERPDVPLAQVRTIEPSQARETGRDLGDLDAVLPAAHSFGRR